jgi:hypothetical protein
MPPAPEGATGLRRVVLLCVTSCFFVVLVSAGIAAGRQGSSKSPSTPSASGDCSKATGLEAVQRLHLNDPEVTDPVYTVLCGSFTGPGSRTMVVSLMGPGSSGMLDWVVFRWTGDAWQLLMKRHQAAVLAAAGSDIRETVSIFRAGDPRCCPSGGTKSRIWHWDGTRFVASAWKQATLGNARTQAYFFTPSRNIDCQMNDDGKRATGVICQSNNPPRYVHMGLAGRLQICRGIVCFGNPGVTDVPAPTVLGYGRQMTVGRLRCLSQRSGVTCTVIRSGKGFQISSAGVRRVGP